MRLRARLALIAGALLIVAVLFAERILAVFAPFVLALLLTAVIDPIVDRLERCGLPRAAGAFGVILLLGLAVAGGAWILLANLLVEVEHFKMHLPEYARGLSAQAEEWVGLLNSVLAEVPHPFDDALLQGVEAATDFLAGAAGSLVSRAGQIPGLVVVGLVALTTTYFLSRDKRILGSFLLLLVPKGWHRELRRLKDEMTSGLLGFVRAQAILIAVSGCLSVLGLVLFRVPYAWILGTLAGILDVVPMVGPSGVFVPVMAWIAGAGDWPRALGVASVWLLILLVRQVIEPYVVGKQVGLHPVTSIAAMYVGGALIGLNGVLLGPVVAILLKAVFVVSVLPLLRQE